MTSPWSSSWASASGGDPQAITSSTTASANRVSTQMCWHPPPEISPPQECTAAPISSPSSPLRRNRRFASCTSCMARCRLPPPNTTPRDSQAAIISSASDRRLAIGLSVVTPLTPASAQAMTASFMYLVGVTTETTSGTISFSRLSASGKRASTPNTSPTRRRRSGLCSAMATISVSGKVW